MSRVPALDGLRAVAVLVVIAYHIDSVPAYGIAIPLADRGWVGVDIFFVLSGFLITTLLLTEQRRTGRISLTRFWARRAARLYPALVLLVAGVLLLWRLGLAHTTPTGATMAMLYLTDLYRAGGGKAGDLGHTWSLAIEEQFYLVWPLVVVALRGRRRIGYAAAGLGLASFALMLATSAHLHDRDYRAYNAPDTRAWELLAGCALAVLLHQRALPRRLGDVAIGPAVLLFGAALLVDLRWGLTALCAVLAAVGVIVAVQAGSRAVGVLALPPLVRIGRISYGVYLYHFPVVHVLTPRLLGWHVPWPAVVLVDVAVTLVLAGVSFRYVEEPIRQAVAAAQARTIEDELLGRIPFPRRGSHVREAATLGLPAPEPSVTRARPDKSRRDAAV